MASTLFMKCVCQWNGIYTTFGVDGEMRTVIKLEAREHFFDVAVGVRVYTIF